ncbi:MAG: SDR family oxidoreductase [Saprospiraceae bacterium]|nr:SDR family oxidoreductase [Saprospiraceae bacterium]
MKKLYAVVTGGTKGIGRAIVQSMVQEGFHVAVCARTESDLLDLVRECSHWEGSVLTYRADLSKTNEVKGFAKFVLDKCTTIDILVNNAGVFVSGSILEEPSDNLETMLQTNLVSAYTLTRALAPTMIQQANGHIFNMCSIASQIAYPNGGSYSISKFALLGFSKVLREELKDKGIRVTAILPGATWSDSWKGVDLPQSRLMQSQDIANLVLSSYKLSNSAVVEEIIIRPQLGDL